MSEGIFIAASGGMKQQRKMEVLGNNLANVNTPGFKKNQMAFEEILPPFTKNSGSGMVASGYSRPEFGGNEVSYVAISGFTTDFSQGVLTNTGNNFDLALEGDGFFVIGTDTGTQYTRTGNFALDDQGQIVNKQGQLFLDINDKPIFIPPNAGQITVGAEGTLTFSNETGTQIIGQFKLVQFNDKNQLIKVGNGLYKLNDTSVTEEFPENIKVVQGFVESSNVNVVQEMVAMIDSVRTFEAYQKLIQSIDEADNQSVNSIARVA